MKERGNSSQVGLGLISAAGLCGSTKTPPKVKKIKRKMKITDLDSFDDEWKDKIKFLPTRYPVTICQQRGKPPEKETERRSGEIWV